MSRPVQQRGFPQQGVAQRVGPQEVSPGAVLQSRTGPMSARGPVVQTRVVRVSPGPRVVASSSTTRGGSQTARYGTTQEQGDYAHDRRKKCIDFTYKYI